MSSIRSGQSRSMRESENVFTKFWHEKAKAPLFGFSYALVKDKHLGYPFFVTFILLELVQMSFFCFRDSFHWGGLNFSNDFNNSVIGYSNFKILFWIVVSIIGFFYCSICYLLYLFHKGALKSSIVLRYTRWMIRIFVKMLYLPILYVLFVVLACDYSTSVPSLLLFPSQPCWSSSGAFISPVAIVFIFLFSGFFFATGLFLNECDPNVLSALPRIQNRFEYLTIATKFVFAAVLTLLMDTPQAFVAISFIIAIVNFSGSLIMLPYYDRKLNIMRSGELAGVLWINLWMVISYIVNDSSSLVTLLLAFCGLPVAIVAGGFAAHRRIKYLSNPALIDGFVSSNEEMQTVKAKDKKQSKKKVKWEKPSTNKLLQNKIYSRLVFPWDVEIAARFVLTGVASPSIVEKAKEVFQAGLIRFPDSHTVLQAYANFLFTIVGDWQLGYVVLEKLRKMGPFVDIQFFIFRYDREREKRIISGSDNIGDFVDFMEFKRLQSDARKQHMNSLTSVRKFWNYLLQPRVDVFELSELTNKIAMAEKRAMEQYTKLLSNHSKNVRVLRDYARFLDEVVLDESAAAEVRRKADKYEKRETESLTASHRSVNEHPKDEINSEASKSMENSEMESLDEKSVSSRSSGIRSGISNKNLDKHRNLKKLGYIMIVTVLLSLALSFVQIGVLDTQLKSYRSSIRFQNTAAAPGINSAKVATRIADAAYIAQVELAARNFTSPAYDAVLSEARGTLYTGLNCLKSIMWGDSHIVDFTTLRMATLMERHMGFKQTKNISSHVMTYEEFDHKIPNKNEINNFFSSPIYVQVKMIDRGVADSRGFPVGRQTSMVNLGYLVQIFQTLSVEMLSLTILQYIGINVGSFIFISENIHEISRGMRLLVQIFSARINDSLNLLRITTYVTFSVGVVMLLLIGAVVIRPAVQRIFATKIKTFSIFTYIPKDVVKALSRRRSLAKEQSIYEDEQDNFKEDDEDRDEPSPSFPNWKAKGLSPLPQLAGSQDISSVDITNDTDARNNNDAEVIDFQNVNSTVTVSINDGEDYAKVEKENLESNTSNPPNNFQAFKRRLSGFALKFTDRMRDGYKQLETIKEEDNEEERVEVDEKGKKRTRKATNSRLDTSSLQAITRKMHLSYILAIAAIIIALLVSTFIIIAQLDDLTDIANGLEDSNYRAQYVQLLTTDISLMPIYNRDNNNSETIISNARRDLKSLDELYSRIRVKSYDMDLVYSSQSHGECVYIDQTKCLKPTDPLYAYASSGLDFLYFSTLNMAEDLMYKYEISNSSITFGDPAYLKFRTLADMTVDGMLRLTFTGYKEAIDKIRSTRRAVAIITTFQCFIVVLVYFVVFRPFVKQLKEETANTFALIRMIPKSLMTQVPEIQKFITETIEDESD